MPGRYKRRGDKQKIAEAFAVRANLDELYLAETDDTPPGSVQPVMSLSDAGERVFEEMRWGSPVHLLRVLPAEKTELHLVRHLRIQSVIQLSNCWYDFSIPDADTHWRSGH